MKELVKALVRRVSTLIKYLTMSDGKRCAKVAILLLAFSAFIAGLTYVSVIAMPAIGVLLGGAASTALAALAWSVFMEDFKHFKRQKEEELEYDIEKQGSEQRSEGFS